MLVSDGVFMCLWLFTRSMDQSDMPRHLPIDGCQQLFGRFREKDARQGAILKCYFTIYYSAVKTKTNNHWFAFLLLIFNVVIIQRVLFFIR